MATIEDVARLARVSKSTASRALQGHPAISKETIERVRMAAEKLRYSPNRAATNLAKRRSHTIVLFVNNLLTRQTQEFHDAVEMVCSQKGFLMMLQKLGDDKMRSERYVRLLREMRIEGVIVVPHIRGVHRDEIALIQEWGIPVIQIDNYVPGSNTDYVGCDNRLGARMAADHLLSLGHERFGVVSSVPASLSCIAERIEAFQQAVGEHGAMPVHVMTAESGEHNAYEFSRRAMHTLLDLSLPPTAIFATSAPTAVGVLRAIRERRLRCPEDIAVVTFDDEQFAGYLETTLTAIHWPAFEIGRTAAELLIRRITKEETEPVRHILLKPELIHRESTLGRGVTLDSDTNNEHYKEVLL